MRYQSSLAIFSLLSFAKALPQPLSYSDLGVSWKDWKTVERSDPNHLLRRAACSGNTADDRSSWCDLSASTDYYTTWPDTGVTREYWLNVEELTLAPDGFERPVMTFNGTIPGPTIMADWGDTIKVHVTNNLQSVGNGTSVHWHGVRQYNSNQNDGVVSVTQCPAAPGDTYTYTFQATQYGSSWYHSHFALQAWEGLFGGLVINGPATANYDEDLGSLSIQDWTHQTVDELYDRAQTGAVEMNNGLINGTNVYGDDGSADQTGYRFNTTFESGKSYLLRVVNVAIDSHFKFSIDNHTMTVIAADFVPIEPYNTTILNVAIAQRYDVIVHADQADVASDFWLRAIPQTTCSTFDSDVVANVKGIVHYASSNTSISTPTTTGYSYTDECVDEALASLVPYVSKDVGDVFYNELEKNGIEITDEGYFRWTINSTSLVIEWDDPTLLQVETANGNNFTFSNTSNAILLPEADKWVYLVIEETVGVRHPIHLHGHDFYILAQSTDVYDPSTSPSDFNLSNPPRRDVALLPGDGYLAIAFQTDNPGAWLLHCHIGWHTLEGFGLQFLERESDILAITDTDQLNSICDNWDTYTTNDNVVQSDDSGI